MATKSNPMQSIAATAEANGLCSAAEFTNSARNLLREMSAECRDFGIETHMPPFYAALDGLASRGVMPNNREVHAHFYSSKRGPAVQVMINVQGQINRMARAGHQVTMPIIVREGDTYSGLTRRLVDGRYVPEFEHKPKIPPNPSAPIIAVVCAFKAAGSDFFDAEELSADDLARRRQQSRGENIWKSWPERMASKSILHAIGRRLADPGGTGSVADMIDGQVEYDARGEVADVPQPEPTPAPAPAPAEHDAHTPTAPAEPAPAPAPSPEPPAPAAPAAATGGRGGDDDLPF